MKKFKGPDGKEYVIRFRTAVQCTIAEASDLDFEPGTGSDDDVDDMEVCCGFAYLAPGDFFSPVIGKKLALKRALDGTMGKNVKEFRAAAWKALLTPRFREAWEIASRSQRSYEMGEAIAKLQKAKKSRRK